MLVHTLTGLNLLNHAHSITNGLTAFTHNKLCDDGSVEEHSEEQNNNQEDK